MTILTAANMDNRELQLPSQNWKGCEGEFWCYFRVIWSRMHFFVKNLISAFFLSSIPTWWNKLSVPWGFSIYEAIKKYKSVLKMRKSGIYRTGYTITSHAQFLCWRKGYFATSYSNGFKTFYRTQDQGVQTVWTTVTSVSAVQNRNISRIHIVRPPLSLSSAKEKEGS